MRQAGIIESEQQARTFCDYLLSQGIECRADQEDGGWLIWIYDDSDVRRAKRELQQFLAQPDELRYTEAASMADQIRRERAEAEKQARQNFVDVRSRWQRGTVRRTPITWVLILLSVLVGLLTKVGGNPEPVQSWLAIAPYERVGRYVQWSGGLEAILSGQYWRLLTPVFLHFGILHLVFNMLWLKDLGGMVEGRLGARKYVFLLLLMAIPANLAQFFVSGPLFGGMSGVVYGLLGFIWMRGRYEPASGLMLHRTTVVWMMAWFAVCFLGIVGNVANTVHAVGLGVGILTGIWPYALRKLKGAS